MKIHPTIALPILAALCCTAAKAVDNRETRTVRAWWKDVDLFGTVNVRDLWAQRDISESEGKFEARLAPHACRLLLMTPIAKRLE